jgi:hypothetical protein
VTLLEITRWDDVAQRELAAILRRAADLIEQGKIGAEHVSGLLDAAGFHLEMTIPARCALGLDPENVPQQS